MKLYDLFRTAWYSIRAYKFRIFLTMIGIIIGIASVSAILAIGEGVKKEATSSIEKSSLNKITIEYHEGFETDEVISRPFEKSDIAEIKKVPGVQKVEENDQNQMFAMNDFEEVSYFNRYSGTEFKKYDEKDRTRKAFLGRNINPIEGKTNKRIIFLSYQVAEELFKEPEKALGKAVKLKGELFEVVGIGEEVNMEDFEISLGAMEEIQEDISIVPARAIREVKKAGDDIENISVFLEPGKDKDEVISEVKEKLYELHPDIKGEYEEFNFQEMIDSMQKVISSITLFVAFAAGISLLVGGIGVMNIMYVSVTERKREIGIRRAIGAKPRSIMLQFLVEAIFITVIGGVIGIILGYIIAIVAGQFMPITPVMTVSNFLGASSISVITGLIFGIIPASKASKLDPIKAIYK